MKCISGLEEREEEMLHKKQSDKSGRKPQLINSQRKKQKEFILMDQTVKCG